MSKPQQWLGALLALQVLLTGALFMHGRQLEAKLSQQSSLLSFDKASVDKLVITGPLENKVTLTKAADGAWQLPDYQKLPVDQGRLDDLLATLSELKGDWPVSTSPNSHQQFEVSEKKFANRVELFSKDKAVAELYMGTSPGFRKTHVRNAKAAEVYAATISAMDVPVMNDQWFDRSLLKAGEVTEIKGEGFVLKKSGADWKLEGQDGAKLNSANAATLAKALSGLRVESLQTSAPTGPPARVLEVMDGSKPLTYQFWVSGGTYTIKRSDKDQTFALSNPIGEMLVSYDVAKLTEAAPSEPGTAPKPGVSPAPAGTPSPATTP